ncbi:hypothetical protein PV11_06941 [Exophiala sideris]|uniref:Xylanolytic transcriptional activator regulatory domain-containing protein n=1 Tax=Exophiala sideris TaxID=1016849 RepID=A0A0D1YX48_9EURO|nr:hypothetical protein PV11_06941 [Exophiala sideris]
MFKTALTLMQEQNAAAHVSTDSGLHLLSPHNQPGMVAPPQSQSQLSPNGAYGNTTSSTEASSSKVSGAEPPGFQVQLGINAFAGTLGDNGDVTDSNLSVGALPTIARTNTFQYEVPNFALRDDTFLEAFFLPEPDFNFPEFDTTLTQWAQTESWNDVGRHQRNLPLGSQPQDWRSIPSASSSTEKDTVTPREVSYALALQVTENDIDRFKSKMQAIDTFGILENFSFPRRARIVRSLTAYFEYFDPHTPFIHHATFSIGEAHPALVLAMLAIGSLHLFEHQCAHTAYEASCNLLHHYGKGVQYVTESESFEFWPIQATLLCIQFGSFGNDQILFQRSQAQFATVSVMLRAGLDVLDEKRLRYSQDPDWATWSFLETYSRLACWACSLCAIVLALDPHATFIFTHQVCELPMPQEEVFWRAGSAGEWDSLAGPASLENNTTALSQLSRSILQGEAINHKISSYGLLTLIGWILSYICNHERLSLGVFGKIEPSFVAKIERALTTWEGLFRAHPLANQVSYEQANCLLTDCLSLLSCAYYHLYLGDGLRLLKSLATEETPRDWEENATSCLNFAAQPNGLKAVRYAAQSWLIRAKMGLAQLHLTAGLTFGGQYFVTAYEGGHSHPVLLASVKPRESRQPDGYDPRIRHTLRRHFPELEEQGMECQDPKSRALAPLIFHCQLMHPKIFMHYELLERRLNRFSAKVAVLWPTTS